MKKILLVDDSALMRRVLSDIINSDDRFHVEKEAKNGLEALEILRTEAFDGVVLDVNMPKMDGIELLRALASEGISARILMASTLTMDGAKVTLDALELGALDFIHKPEWSYKCKENDFDKELLDTLYAVCNAKLKSVAPVKPVSRKKIEIQTGVEQLVRKKAASITGNRLVAIAISTGGPKSLQSVIPFLPEDLNAPVVIVQHMPEGFTKMYADRLDRICKMQAKEAEDGDRLRNGLIILGHGSKQLEVHKDASGFYVTSRPGEKVSGHCPSVDVLFRSVAKVSGKGTIGVILTGMGRDGAYGLADMRKAGAYTIGQDEPSCVVYGMPCVAYEEGAVIKQAPLGEIKDIIVGML